MKFSAGRFGNWLQIGANLGIIAGLLLVGLQLKQNSDLLRTQLLYEESGRFIESEHALYGENAARVWAKSIENPDELNLEERRVIDAYLYSTLESWRSTHMLSEHGLLVDDADWQLRVRDEASYFLGNEYGRAWWSVYREENLMIPPELISIIDEELAADPNGTLEYQDKPLQRMRDAR